MTHLLSVFRAGEDTHGDVDMAILQALLKGEPGWSSCARGNLSF